MPRRGRLSCLSAAAQAWTRPLERAVPALGDGDGWLVAFEARNEGNRPRIHLRSVASDGTATGSVTQVVEEDGVFESDRAAPARDRNTDDVLLVYARTQPGGAATSRRTWSAAWSGPSAAAA